MDPLTSTQRNIIRAVLAVDLVIFAGNFSFGLYIVLRKFMPMRIRFKLLWLFYATALFVSALDISLMV